MKCKRKKDAINIQAALSRDLNAEPEESPLDDVIKITPNTCIQKDICGGCGRGDHYGIPLHFILHYLDGGLRTVCFGCGKKAASKTGLKLPPTESDIFAREEESDMRRIRIAIRKMDAKNG